MAEFIIPNPQKTDRRSATRWIISHVKPYWWLVLALMVGAFGNAALASVVPVYIGKAFNIIFEDPKNRQALIQVALLIGGSQLVRGLLQLGRNFSAEFMAQRLERDVRDELYSSLLGKSMAFHNLQPVGDTMARATNDVREINLMFNPGVNLVIGSANFLILPLLMAPRYHPSLILVPLIFIVAYALAIRRYLNTLQPITKSVRSAFGKLNARLAESIDGIEIVKGQAQEKDEARLFSSNAKAYRDVFVHQGDIEARFIPLLLFGLAVAGAFLHAMILFNQGLLDLGDVVGYVGLIDLFGFPTFVSLFSYSQVSLGMASAQRILELINRETKLDRNPSGYHSSMRGEIEFQNATFGYLAGENQLESISFHIKPGKTIAIVGQTGAGKTTLARLINRSYDTNAGRVLVDGIDVRDWDLESLRRSISIIEQDIFLFARTIAENIAFGHPKATISEIEAAAHAAQAHDFITRLPAGYQTIVGERGVTLSGGQRQRLALARAFLTDPHILILDDATSSIDSATEDKIQRAIFRAAQGRTTLIITHRLSQIRWADLILVMRQGHIAAQGTHKELIRQSKSYRQIFARLGDD
jgi:ATP-binding cassette subfamily B protein